MPSAHNMSLLGVLRPLIEEVPRLDRIYHVHLKNA